MEMKKRDNAAEQRICIKEINHLLKNIADNIYSLSSEEIARYVNIVEEYDNIRKAGANEVKTDRVEENNPALTKQYVDLLHVLSGFYKDVDINKLSPSQK